MLQFGIATVSTGIVTHAYNTLLHAVWQVLQHMVHITFIPSFVTADIAVTRIVHSS